MDFKVLEFDETIKWYDSARMIYKHAAREEDQKLYGEFKAKVAQTRAELEKFKRAALNDLIALIPESSRGEFAAGWAAKYVFERLAPIASTLTPEQQKRIREHCQTKGDVLGKINNTPERSIQHIETYKEVYERVLTGEQKRRVEPR